MTGQGTIDPKFFRLAAAASLLATLGVLVAQFGLTGYPTPASPEETIRLYTHPVFRAQGWVIFAQVFLMFLALWGCTLKMARRAPALILTGFLFFVFWQVLEIIPRSIELSAMSYVWGPEFVETQDAAVRDRLLSTMRGTGTALAGIGVGRRVVWALGHLVFGLAFWSGTRLMRLLGLFFLLNFLRLAVRMGGEMTDWAWLFRLTGGDLGFVLAMVPLFALLAWWLWTEPRQLDPVGKAPRPEHTATGD